MKFQKNSRSSRTASKNLAGCELRFTGSSIVLDYIGEKPSCLLNCTRFYGHRLIPYLSSRQSLFRWVSSGDTLVFDRRNTIKQFTAIRLLASSGGSSAF